MPTAGPARCGSARRNLRPSPGASPGPRREGLIPAFDQEQVPQNAPSDHAELGVDAVAADLKDLEDALARGDSATVAVLLETVCHHPASGAAAVSEATH